MSVYQDASSSTPQSLSSQHLPASLPWGLPPDRPPRARSASGQSRFIVHEFESVPSTPSLSPYSASLASSTPAASRSNLNLSSSMAPHHSNDDLRIEIIPPTPHSSMLLQSANSSAKGKARMPSAEEAAAAERAKASFYGVANTHLEPNRPKSVHSSSPSTSTITPIRSLAPTRFSASRPATAANHIPLPNPVSTTPFGENHSFLPPWQTLILFALYCLTLLATFALVILSGLSLNIFRQTHHGDEVNYNQPAWPDSVNLLPSWLFLAFGFCGCVFSFTSAVLLLKPHNPFKPREFRGYFAILAAVTGLLKWSVGLAVYIIFDNRDNGSLSWWACDLAKGWENGIGLSGVNYRAVCLEQRAGMGLCAALIGLDLLTLAAIGATRLRNRRQEGTGITEKVAESYV